ncbi:hypothetical protein [Corynebacterium tuberculostearicum]|nr:hypothetical protein [Corynebacterium tuberculostearicum]MDK8677430.1 hypothetical protein [Corynebacterium tuberculostearicum]
MTDIVHEAQDTHLRAVYQSPRGGGDYEYALDAATLARLVRAAQRALS